jgi:hypothetical protein
LESLFVAGFYLFDRDRDALCPRLLFDDAMHNQLLNRRSGEPVVADLDEFAGADRLAVDGRYDSIGCR